MKVFILGTSDKRQEDVVKDLNFEYAHYLEENKNIASAYKKMVEKNPYRILGGKAVRHGCNISPSNLY